MEKSLDRCRIYEDLGIWPTQPRLKAESWLNNFNASELPFANALLAHFMYFNEYMCAQLLRTAFASLTSYFQQFELNVRQQEWDEFLRTAVFTYPAGKNPSKSGPSVVRLARQELGFDESRMLLPDEALAQIVNGKTKYVVLVDDFVGSGEQFTTTWHTGHSVADRDLTFKQVCSGGVVAFYIPYISTAYGAREIASMCENYHLYPGQVLGDNYCVFAKDSVVWPKELRHDAESIIAECSHRAGLENYRGHYGLGFTVAAHRSIPDTTLPLFYHASDTWRPLMERK